MWIAVIYLWVVNTLTLLAFGWDKLRARQRKRRVPERNLLWLATLGGSPGALLGRWIFSVGRVLPPDVAGYDGAISAETAHDPFFPLLLATHEA